MRIPYFSNYQAARRRKEEELEVARKQENDLRVAKERVAHELESKANWPGLILGLKVDAFFNNSDKFILPVQRYYERVGYVVEPTASEAVTSSFSMDFPNFFAALGATKRHLKAVQAVLEKCERLLTSYSASYKGTYTIFQLRKMEPKQFESFVAQHFRDLGYQARLIGGANDGGIDVIAVKGNDKILIQCKRYSESNNVGAEVIQSIAGSTQKVAYTGYRGLVVTTGSFTQEALRQQRDYRPGLVELWDHRALIRGIQEQARKTDPKIIEARNVATSIQQYLASFQTRSLESLGAEVRSYAERTDFICGSGIAQEIKSFQHVLMTIPILPRVSVGQVNSLNSKPRSKIRKLAFVTAASLLLFGGYLQLTQHTDPPVTTNGSSARQQKPHDIPQATDFRSLIESHPSVRLHRPRKNTQLEHLTAILRDLPRNKFHNSLPRLYREAQAGILCKDESLFRSVENYVRNNRVVTSPKIAPFWWKVVENERTCSGAT